MEAKTDRVSGWQRAGSWTVNVGAGSFVIAMLYVLVATYILG